MLYLTIPICLFSCWHINQEVLGKLNDDEAGLYAIMSNNNLTLKEKEIKTNLLTKDAKSLIMLKNSLVLLAVICFIGGLLLILYRKKILKIN